MNASFEGILVFFCVKQQYKHSIQNEPAVVVRKGQLKMDYIFGEAYIIREMIFTGWSSSDILINNYEVS